MMSSQQRSTWMLLLPAIALLAVFFVYPLGEMLSRSFYDPEFTLKHYERLAAEPAYLWVLWATFEIAAIVTVCSLLLGYPLAYMLSQIRPRTAALLMIIVVVPYFTSVLVRTYAWMVILGAQGIVNQFLTWTGLIDAPLAIMYSRTAVVIGMTYIMLPYMILALFSVMRAIDTNLLLAAESLGAGRAKSFWRIFIPLSLPGVAAGSLLVFILSLGFFITPALMGSQEDSMISMLVESQVETYFDWGFASTLATLLLICTLILFVIYERLVGLNKLFEAKL